MQLHFPLQDQIVIPRDDSSAVHFNRRCVLNKFKMIERSSTLKVVLLLLISCNFLISSH